MKTVSDLCREALKLREKATQGRWVTGARKIRVPCIYSDDNKFVEGQYPAKFIASFGPYNMHATGEHRVLDRDFTVFAANHIKAIAERCLELEEEVEGYRSGNLPTWKSEYDLIKSVCDEVDKNNEELRAENIRLRALVANPNLEEWYLKSENLRMVCIRLARAKTIEKRDQVASKCKHLFSDVKDILRGDEALKGGQGG